MRMIQFQGYIMTCWEYILMNTMIYQMQKEKNQSTNINLKCYFLNYITMISGLIMYN